MISSQKLLKSKPYLGFDYIMPDDDRIVRHHSLVMNYEGYYYPSLSLAATSAYLGKPLDQVKVTEAQKITIDSTTRRSCVDSCYF